MPDNLPPIEHVVVLMMENHSFDNLLGWLPGVGELTGEEYNLAKPSDPHSERFYVTKGASFTTTPDPAHDLADVNYQLFGNSSPTLDMHPKNAWFVEDFLRQKPTGSGAQFMACYTPEQLPAISTLAKNFTTLTRWFSAIPGPTGPNRLFTHCATSGGYAGDQYELEANTHQIPTNLNTIYQHLMDMNKSWGIYWEDFSTAATQKQLQKHPDNFHPFKDFYHHVAENKLSNYTFLTPRLCPGQNSEPATAQHPSYDIRAGDELIADVYECIRNSALWEKTLLLITYDEHGGFYDSITPTASVPNPDGKVYKKPPGFDFKRLGVRVPAIAVSAYTDPGVNKTIFEHSSIAATLKVLFDLPDFLTRRDSSANNLLPVFNRTTVRTTAPTTLPRPPGQVAAHQVKNIEPVQQILVQQMKSILSEQQPKQHVLLTQAVNTDIDAGRFLTQATLTLLGKKP